MKSLRNFAIALMTVGITTLASAQSEAQAPNEKAATPEVVQTETKEAPVEKEVPTQKAEQKEVATV